MMEREKRYAILRVAQALHDRNEARARENTPLGHGTPEAKKACAKEAAYLIGVHDAVLDQARAHKRRLS